MSGRTETQPTTDRLIWTAGIVIGATVPHWSHLPIWAPLLLAAAVVWRLAAPVRAWPLPRAALRLGLAVAALAAVLHRYGTINGVEPGSALLVVMMALKFLETASQRDELVLIIISYFLVFASLLYSQSMPVALYLLAFVWVATVGLLQLGRRGALLPPAAFAVLAARLLLQSLPIMVALFVLFPRLPGPLWGIGNASTDATTGLSDTMSPGDITHLAVSEDVAFRVEFAGAPPPADRLYWRGPVLARFDGRTWSRAPFLGNPRPLATIDHAGAATRYRVMLEPQTRRWLLALDMPVEWSGPTPMFMGGDYTLLLPRHVPAPSRFDYRVTLYTDYHAREALTPIERRIYTALPEGSDPRARALAQSWLEDGTPPDGIVDRALDFFRGHEFFYTLTPPASGGPNPTDRFLFDTRKGFCEHYASAFAVLMRAAGVPARVVTGYQGGELNTLGDYYIVRQADAHAWTEVWLEGRGWVRVDPVAAVAPARIADGSPEAALGRAGAGAGERSGWMHRASLALDAVDTYWNDWIVGYGPRLQVQLMRSLGMANPSGTKLALLAAAATLALLGGLGAWLSWRRRIRRPRADAASRAFGRFCRGLARRGVAPRGPAEGPAAFTARAAASLPEAADAIAAVGAAYLAARYEPDADGAAIDRLERLVAEAVR